VVWWVAGDGLRSVGEEALPSSKSVCSILPIARRLRAAPFLTRLGAALRFAALPRPDALSSPLGRGRPSPSCACTNNQRLQNEVREISIGGVPGPIGAAASLIQKSRTIEVITRSGKAFPVLPPDRALFTGVRGMGILGSTQLQAPPLGGGLSLSGRGCAGIMVPIVTALAAFVAWIRCERLRLATSELPENSTKG
jgi:hypothetical protein